MSNSFSGSSQRKNFKGEIRVTKSPGYVCVRVNVTHHFFCFWHWNALYYGKTVEIIKTRGMELLFRFYFMFSYFSFNKTFSFHQLKQLDHLLHYIVLFSLTTLIRFSSLLLVFNLILLRQQKKEKWTSDGQQWLGH